VVYAHALSMGAEMPVFGEAIPAASANYAAFALAYLVGFDTYCGNVVLAASIHEFLVFGLFVLSFVLEDAVRSCLGFAGVDRRRKTASTALGLKVINFGAEYGFLGTLADDDNCLELTSSLLGLILKLLLNPAFLTAHGRIKKPNEIPISHRSRPESG
jgi:hypothetical protein